jgi:hypothetical protein
MELTEWKGYIVHEQKKPFEFLASQRGSQKSSYAEVFLISHVFLFGLRTRGFGIGKTYGGFGNTDGAHDPYKLRILKKIPLCHAKIRELGRGSPAH